MPPGSQRCRRAARAFGSLALVVGVCAASPAGADWRRIDSPNFVVLGDVSGRELRDVAVRFEAFRETLGRILSARAIATVVPAIVIVFPSERAFAPFAPRYDGRAIELSGLFAARPDVNYIAIVNNGGIDRLQVVFHEYAHLLLSNTGRPLPLWLEEGLADLYSTFELARGGRQAVLGSPVSRHLANLQDAQLLPLERLLTVTHDSPLYNEGQRRSMFYGQSWALTHLLLLGEPNRTPKLLAYLDAVDRGEEPVAAWTSAFAGDDIPRLLASYVRRHSYRAIEYRFSTGLASFDAPAVPVSPADADAFLAEFLLQQGRIEEAAARLHALGQREPDNERLAIGLIQLDLARKGYESAASRLQRIRPPNDWLLAYLAGIAAADLAETGTERLLPAELDGVRRFFDVARDAAVELPNALARMSALELRSEGGPTPATRDALARARSLAPGRADYTLLHAQVLGQLDELDAARAALRPLLTSASPGHVRDSARTVMDHLARIERLRSEQFAAMLGVPAAAREPARSLSAAESATERRPLFRPVKPGETRIEGALERIDCVSGLAVALHVRTADGIVAAQAAELDDVEFISYRDDVRGVLQCGPLKDPMPVLLTWRTAADPAATRIAVAVEFLPKRK